MDGHAASVAIHFTKGLVPDESAALHQPAAAALLPASIHGDPARRWGSMTPASKGGSVTIASDLYGRDLQQQFEA